MFVCLFVCPSVRFGIAKKHTPEFHPIFCRCFLWSWLGPAVTAMAQRDTLCTSGFVNDVMFSHNGANGPESRATRMSRPVRQMAAPVDGHSHCHSTASLNEQSTVPWRHRGRSLPAVSYCIWFGPKLMFAWPFAHPCCAAS